MIELLNEVDSQVEVAPYWNVNVKTKGTTTEQAFVEVAPYWNVNEDTKELEDKFAE